MKSFLDVARGAAVLAAGAWFAIAAPGAAQADAGHAHGDAKKMLEEMRDLHSGHQHGHDFEAMEAMDPADMNRMMAAMQDIGLAVPPMNSGNGRQLFVAKGCIVCHAVNGVGGEVGPPINAGDMPETMSTFDFAARMWRGAGAMIAMQEDLFGEQIDLSGQDLADLIAFAHDAGEQKKLRNEDIPERFRALME